MTSFHRLAIVKPMPVDRPEIIIHPPHQLPGSDLECWTLDPEYDYLNHGSFGARPKAIADIQTQWQVELNARPVNLLDRQWKGLLAGVKDVVGKFLGAEPDDFGLVTNATGGVNAVMRSLRFKPGDELLTTNHVYNAVRNSMRHLAEQAGATYIEAQVPFPIESPDQVIKAIEESITPRTRLVLVDHVTSPTAIVYPVERIAELCRMRGIDLMIDGAHAPGMLDLNVPDIGATYYTGNLHKWVCAPLGAAFLWVTPERQDIIHPTTISHYLDQGFAGEFSWQGTCDVTPWLCAKDAIQWFEAIGWTRVREHNHQLAVWVQSLLEDMWNVGPTTPPETRDGSMLGSMTALAVPPGLDQFESAEALRDTLYNEHKIEVPVFDWNDTWWIRMSCQVYNRPEQYERLGDAMLQLASNN